MSYKGIICTVCMPILVNEAWLEAISLVGEFAMGSLGRLVCLICAAAASTYLIRQDLEEVDE